MGEIAEEAAREDGWRREGELRGQDETRPCKLEQAVERAKAIRDYETQMRQPDEGLVERILGEEPQEVPCLDCDEAGCEKCGGTGRRRG